MNKIIHNEKEQGMGRVQTQFKAWNFSDEIDSRKGRIKETEIRRYEGEGLVDTGATFIVLPANVVEALGLETDREVTVVYADGRRAKKKIARGLMIEMCGRRAEMECIVETNDAKPLIGQLPLEAMDLIPDPKNGKLTPRPGYEDSPLIELY